MNQNDKQFIMYVGAIIKQSAKSAKEQGLSLDSAIELTNENIRKFIDYTTAFMEVDASMIDKIISIFPAFGIKAEELSSAIIEDISVQRRTLRNTGKTNYSSFIDSRSSSSCGSSSSSYGSSGSSSC